MRNTRLHLLFMLAGLIIAILLGFHLTVLHLDTVLGFFGVDTAQPTSWDSMIERSRQSIWVGLYITLLAAGLYHALYGLRGIVLEVTTSGRTQRAVSWAFVIVGIMGFIVGSYVSITLLFS